MCIRDRFLIKSGDGGGDTDVLNSADPVVRIAETRWNDACRPPARIAARSRAKNGKSGRLPVAIDNRDGADLAITALAGVARERTPRRPTTPEPVRAAGPR